MGTRGCYSYRYRKKYLAKHVQSDGYPEGLGKDLISYIPVDREEFDRWLKRLRAEVLKFQRKAVEERKAAKHDEDADSDEADMYDEAGASDLEDLQEPYIHDDEDVGDENGDDTESDDELGAADIEDLGEPYIRDRISDDFRLMTVAPDKFNWDAAWRYVYDLDNLAFTIEDGFTSIHLRLDNIPRGADGKYWIKLVKPDPEDSDYDPDDDYYLRRSRKFSEAHFTSVLNRRSALFINDEDMEVLATMQCAEIDSTIWLDRSERPYQVMHRRLTTVAAKGLLAGHYSKFSRVRGSSKQQKFVALAMELLTAASPAGSMFDCVSWFTPVKDNFKRMEPTGKGTFWFRGRLVVLVDVLDEKNALKLYAAKATQISRDMGLAECTVILWSIDHIAVVEVCKNHISWSKALPFAVALRQDTRFQETMRMINYYLPPPCSQGDATSSGIFSIETFRVIMDFADPKTLFMMGRTSKALRLEWYMRPSIGNYVLVSNIDEGVIDEHFIVVEHGDKRESRTHNLFTFNPPKCDPNCRWDGGVYDSLGMGGLAISCRRVARYLPDCDVLYQARIY